MGWAGACQFLVPVWAGLVGQVMVSCLSLQERGCLQPLLPWHPSTPM
jgi:hypothetical protein